MPELTTAPAVRPEAAGGCSTHCPHGGECSLVPDHETWHKTLASDGQVLCTWPLKRPEAAAGCEPVDMIVTWTDSTGALQVFPGDLVLSGGRMELVEDIAYDPPEDEAVRVRYRGGYLTRCEPASALVAVTRYVTTGSTA